MGYDTAGSIINDALVEVGLSAVSDPFADSDSNVIQMCTLLKSKGREILRQRFWTQMRGEHTFTTVLGTPTYALPSDFHSMVDQSGWNRTNRLPLGGPLSPQEWQFLKSRLVGVVFTVLFRPMEGEIHLYPDTNTPGGYTVAFEYLSNGWIERPAIPTNTFHDSPVAMDDIVRFDSLMVMRGIKLEWLKLHAFDTTSAQQDYLEVYNRAAGMDSFNPILSLTRAGLTRGVDPLLGQQSVPVTGFGT